MPALDKAKITSAIPDSIRMAFGYLSINTAFTSSRSSCVGAGPSRRRRIEDRRATPNRVDYLHAVAATRRNAMDAARAFQVIARAVDGAAAAAPINAAAALNRRRLSAATTWLLCASITTRWLLYAAAVASSRNARAAFAAIELEVLRIFVVCVAAPLVGLTCTAPC